MEVMGSMRHCRVSNNQAGFGLIEVMLAMFVTTIGLVTLLALFAQAIATTQLSQLDMIARQKAREALESIYTARNTTRISFDQIRNAPDGLFLTGFQELRLPNSGEGGDGLVGTQDDGDIETMRNPGKDGIAGNEDDEIVPLDNFERQIVISGLAAGGGGNNPDLRRIAITVRYTTPWGTQRSYAVESYVSRFR